MINPRPYHLFLSTRPMFFPASTLPILVGSAWGWQQSGTIDWIIFIFALAGMLCLHAGANVLNDVGDELNGSDRANVDRIPPFTGGSRFIQNGVLSIKEMATFGAALLFMAVLLGLILTWHKGPTILVLGGLGGGLAIAYSLKPFSLASRGLGEVAVAVAFGLPVAASGWLQSGVVPPALLFCAGAVGCWAASILIVNEVPDIAADSFAGKLTLVVRLGIAKTRWLFLFTQCLAALLAFCAALSFGNAPLIGAPIILFLAAALWIAPRIAGDRADLLIAIQSTLLLHLAGGIWLLTIAFVNFS